MYVWAKFIIGFNDHCIKIFLTDCTMKDWKIEKSKIDVNLKYQMQMVNKFPFSLNRLLIKDSIHLRTPIVIYSEVIPSIVVRIAEFKEAPSVHVINRKINWKFA